VRQKLEEIRRILVNRRALLCNATLDQKDRPAFERQLHRFLAGLPASSRPLAAWTPAYAPRNEGLTLPAQVNYVGKAANLYELGYALDGSASVITRYLSTTWLWDRVRVQGGAYGAFCSFDPFTGVLAYASYRDPNLFRTLEVYDGSGQFLRQLRLDDNELTKAIIGTIGDLDAYQLPDAKGYTSMVRLLTGVTDEYRQQLRDQVLDTSADDFREFAGVLEQAGQKGRVAVLGSAEAIEAANQERPGWLEKVKVM
jgi:Zn-dependent M16 (insulinase) family peptidase